MGNEVGELLVRRLRQQEPAAYRLLIEHYTPLLFPIVGKLLRDTNDVEDILQETFLKCWRSIDQFEGRSDLRTWLHRIAVNAALSRLRARKAAREMPLNEQLLGTALGNTIYQNTTETNIWELVSELPEDYQSVMLLRYVDELSTSEVAQVLGISDDLVRQRLHRARRAVVNLVTPDQLSTASLPCGGNTDLLLDFLDQSLTGESQQLVQGHLANCAACQVGKMNFVQLIHQLLSPCPLVLPPYLMSTLIAAQKT